MDELNTGDTAFILISAAMVLLMTPGLAFFYGGMTRAKSVLNMMMMSFIALATVPVVWVLWGYSMAFGGSSTGFIAGFDALGMSGVTPESMSGTIPEFAFAAFQMMFAIITVALISGAIADRAKFGTWTLFTVLWVTLVYFPVAHNVWGGGWLATTFEPIIDFAGGTAVHINAGAAALALALVIGRRIGFKKDPMRPHNLPFVMLGAALLWFGWFGFNAGSALAADGTASSMLLNTAVATAAAILGWLLVEVIRDKAATSLGAASGAIGGLVAITPSGANVSPVGAVIIGLAAGVITALAVSLKYRFGYDDSLDVVGIHMVGGLVGSLLVGLLAAEAFGGTAGSVGQLGRQAAASFIVLGYSFLVTYLIGMALDKTIGFRIKDEDEVSGVDLTTHAETAYEFFATGGSSTSSGSAATSAPVQGKVNA